MTTIEQSTPKAAWYGQSAHDVAAELGVEALAQFLHVGLAASRRRADSNSSPVIVARAIAVIGVVLGFFVVDSLQTAPETFTAIILPGLLALVLHALVRRHRRTMHPPQSVASPSPTPSG
jgi:hypothetical protein